MFQGEACNGPCRVTAGFRRTSLAWRTDHAEAVTNHFNVVAQRMGSGRDFGFSEGIRRYPLPPVTAQRYWT